MEVYLILKSSTRRHLTVQKDPQFTDVNYGYNYTKSNSIYLAFFCYQNTTNNKVTSEAAATARIRVVFLFLFFFFGTYTTTTTTTK